MSSQRSDAGTLRRGEVVGLDDKGWRPVRVETATKEQFFERVYCVVRLVPRGQVTTYGSIAYALGEPGKARVVGYALAALRGRKEIPAHRVVNRSGIMTGRHAFGTPERLRKLLASEGITFLDEDRVDLEHHLYIPPSLED